MKGKKRKPQQKITISFRLEEKINSQLNNLSEDLQMTKSYLIQEALVKYLAQGKKVQN